MLQTKEVYKQPKLSEVNIAAAVDTVQNKVIAAANS
jgi:hypothetical protein